MICKNKTVNFSTKERFSRYFAREELKLEELRGGGDGELGRLRAIMRLRNLRSLRKLRKLW
jgi:hypothetical protein